MIPAAELKMRRRNVREFIRVDSAVITLIRQVRTKTPSGGYEDTPAPQAPQTVRLVPAKRRYGSAFVNSEAGQVEKYPYNLVGYHDMDIAEHDKFEYLGNWYEVETIEPDREERTQAALIYSGAPTSLPSS